MTSSESTGHLAAFAEISHTELFSLPAALELVAATLQTQRGSLSETGANMKKESRSGESDCLIL